MEVRALEDAAFAVVERHVAAVELHLREIESPMPTSTAATITAPPRAGPG